MTELTEELVMVANNLVKLLEVFDCNNMNDIEKYESLKNEVEELTKRFEKRRQKMNNDKLKIGRLNTRLTTLHTENYCLKELLRKADKEIK